MKDKVVVIPSTEEVENLNAYEATFNRDYAIAIKWLYRLQQWTGEKISEQVPDVKPSLWDSYAQPGYTKNRSLHIVAIFSWLSQTTMSVIYYGPRIQNYWPGVTKEIIESIIYTSFLPPEQFDYFINYVFQELKSKNKISNININDKLTRLNKYVGVDFLIPKNLCVDDFKKDYYQSIAINLKKFRLKNKLTREVMAYVLNVSPGRYDSFESVDNPVSISLHLGMRLKLGFKLEDTVPFTDNMAVYPQFKVCRTVQQLREDIIIDLMSPLDGKTQQLINQFAESVMKFHKS